MNEMMSDPIMQLLMRSDGVADDDVRALVQSARLRLRRRSPLLARLRSTAVLLFRCGRGYRAGAQAQPLVAGNAGKFGFPAIGPAAMRASASPRHRGLVSGRNRRA
ncbi:MAG: hypothetical protein HY521_13100 [Proteobacteria bacterium]|nr:hypothetical protein [Pseudomonadota bacterium]